MKIAQTEIYKSKRKFIDRWTDHVYTVPELYELFTQDNTGFTFPQWLDLQMEWNGGNLEELRVKTANANQTTKTLARLKRESLQLLSDFEIVITPAIRKNVNAARNERELERVRRSVIEFYI